ncbi:MAG: hypothetical protein V7709_17270 [Halioglobus sp.]
MKRNTALARYLERYIESDLPDPPPGAQPWQHVLVIPAYAESPTFLDRLNSITGGSERTLVIVVLNRPEPGYTSDTSPVKDTKLSPNGDDNQPLRDAIAKLKKTLPGATELSDLSDSTQLYLLDMERLLGPTSAAQGVGLARKFGCDLALLWQSRQFIESEWICCSDADATLPSDYFQRLAQTEPDTAAAVYPFIHVAGKSAATHLATTLYELRLHHYVLGLEYAKSPYAYHTLGSALAIKANHYAQVRGFPKRAGGEDFYLLNKAAKTGTVTRLTGSTIELLSRASARVPFGTGPAVEKILMSDEHFGGAIFYHPQCFEALRIWLEVAPGLFCEPLKSLPLLLENAGLTHAAASTAAALLKTMGLEGAIAHCHKQGKSKEQFNRQFHQWFDGFRTLKFIHALRASDWPDQTLDALSKLQPCLWPAYASAQDDIDALQINIQKHWGWTTHHQ